MSRRYPQEVHAFLRRIIPGRTENEVAELVSQKFPDYQMTDTQIHAYKSNHRIRSGTKGGTHPGFSKLYSAEIQNYIIENHKGVGPSQMAQKVNDKFGTKYSCSQLKAFYGNHHLNSGVTGYFKPGLIPANKGKKQSEYMTPEGIEKARKTQFKPGSRPHNAVPVGTIVRTTEEHYLVQKIAEPDQWVFVHRAVWEAAYGPIPPGMVVCFKDGDHENCSLDNLMLISRAEHGVMNKHGLRYNAAELAETGLLIAKIKMAKNRRKKHGK